MKILSRMLSKKVEPQKAPVLDQDDEVAQFADDSGRRNSSRSPSRDALFADPARPIKPKPEEPEVAASGGKAAIGMMTGTTTRNGATMMSTSTSRSAERPRTNSIW